MKNFKYQGLDIKPIRQFTTKEAKQGINLKLSSQGISNYNFRPNDIPWDYDEFYRLAESVGAGTIDIFLVKGNESVPGQNELFKFNGTR